MKVRWLGALAPDPSLKGLRKLTEGDGARKFAHDLTTAVPLTGTEIAVMPVKQRIGQRAVLRIDADGGERFYVKILRGAGGERRAAALTEIAECAGRSGVQVPLPVAWLPRFHALVTADLDGVPLLESIDLERLASLGRALARLHADLPRPALERGRAFERSTLASVSRRIALRPETDRATEREMERLIESEPPESERFVSLHGDLYLDQVRLLPDGRFGILDWDNACAGEAERDAGNLVAHLILEEERGMLEGAATLADSFLRGYASGGRLRPSVLDWYVIASLLRIAFLHADPGFGSRPPNSPELPGRLVRRARKIADLP